MRIPMNSGAFGSDLGRQDPMFSKWEVLSWRLVLCRARDTGKLGSRSVEPCYEYVSLPCVLGYPLGLSAYNRPILTP